MKKIIDTRQEKFMLNCNFDLIILATPSNFQSKKDCLCS